MTEEQFQTVYHNACQAFYVGMAIGILMIAAFTKLLTDWIERRNKKEPPSVKETKMDQRFLRATEDKPDAWSRF